MILPAPWTWPTVVTAIVSLVALGLSVATLVQRYRLNPQPKLVADWGRGDIIPSEVNYTPCATLWVRNHGDAAARDVRVWVSTLPTPDGDATTSQGVVEPGDALGHIQVPLTRQTKFEFNLDSNLNYGHVLTVPPDQVKYEVPVVTIRWHQPPFKKKPREMRVKVPKRLMGPAKF